MRNLTIKLEADDDMTVLRIKAEREKLTNCQYAFMLYQLLLELAKQDKDNTLVAIDAFFDDLKERGEL